jgi:hypothetical protein
MSYEEHLTNYIQQVANLQLMAKSALTSGVSAAQESMVRTVELETGKAKDTLTANKNALLRAYDGSGPVGKAKLEADLKEMVLGIDQARTELRKIIGG